MYFLPTLFGKVELHYSITFPACTHLLVMLGLFDQDTESLSAVSDDLISGHFLSWIKK